MKTVRGCRRLKPMSDALFSNLPTQQILDALEKSPGNEVASGKLDNPQSSAALAVNTFGLFLDHCTPGTRSAQAVRRRTQ